MTIERSQGQESSLETHLVAVMSLEPGSKAAHWHTVPCSTGRKSNSGVKCLACGQLRKKGDLNTVTKCPIYVSLCCSWETLTVGIRKGWRNFHQENVFFTKLNGWMISIVTKEIKSTFVRNCYECLCLCSGTVDNNFSESQSGFWRERPKNIQVFMDIFAYL